ncbi:hypothetical protein HHK36_028869 [Tetracentron sinense]|uniref:UBX domain-containing protein n=1 Tax=Tetracentron sinense TaxID=13715 RepID=A0A834YH02_TETSI|nr:hypothetical protein HHK36_028869 [Tetracentron sinense]
MARPNQDAVDTFMSITGASEALALQKLEEHGGNLNEAVNAHFSEGDGNITHPTSAASPQNDFMDIDEPIHIQSQEPSLPLFSSERGLAPFSLLDPDFQRRFFDGRGVSESERGLTPFSLFDSDFRRRFFHERAVSETKRGSKPFSLLDPDFQRRLFDGRGVSESTSRTPFVSHPREVRDFPIEFKEGNEQAGHSEPRPTIEDVTGTAYAHGPEIHGEVIIDDEDEEDIPTAPSAHAAGHNNRKDGFSSDSLRERHPRPSAPEVSSLPDYGVDLEEEMIQAAIEASKREVEEGYSNQQFGAPDDLSGSGLQQRQSHLEDAELACAVSLSLKTAEQEKALHEQGGQVGAAELRVFKPAYVDALRKLIAANERQGFGSFNEGTSSQSKFEASLQYEAEDVGESPLVRHRTGRVSSGSMDSAGEIGETMISPPSSAGLHDIGNHSQHNRDTFHSDEWGGISSEEHDEAVMLETALFGGIPEGTAYHFGHTSHQLMQTGSDRTAGLYPWQISRPPSPTLTAQRLIREQQDDEYLASLQADREKELRAMEEAETRRIGEQGARKAALEERRQKEEESRKKLLEEEEFERQLAAKEASLPHEPASDNEGAVTLLVRMPDGSRRGRRFLKSDKLQFLFDFVDVGRVVKPRTYRLVRPYPRRAFSDGESALTLNELGLTSKQEALFLELI